VAEANANAAAAADVGEVKKGLSKEEAEKILEKTQKHIHDQLIAKLPENECRWVAYDFHYLSEEKQPRSKILLISWSPDTATTKDKMAYASSKDAIKRALSINSHEIQATDLDEVAYEAAIDKAGRK